MNQARPSIEQSDLTHPRLIRSNAGAWLVFAAVVGLPTGLIGNPSLPLQLLALSSTAILGAWAGVHFLWPEKYQRFYVLFLGVCSLLMSILLVLASFRFWTLNPQARVAAFWTITTTLYGASLALGVVLYRISLRLNQNRDRGRTGASIIGIASAAGLLVGKLLLGSIKDQDVVVLVMSFLLLLLGCLCALSIPNLHKHLMLAASRELKQ